MRRYGIIALVLVGILAAFVFRSSWLPLVAGPETEQGSGTNTGHNAGRAGELPTLALDRTFKPLKPSAPTQGAIKPAAPTPDAGKPAELTSNAMKLAALMPDLPKPVPPAPTNPASTKPPGMGVPADGTPTRRPAGGASSTPTSPGASTGVAMPRAPAAPASAAHSSKPAGAGPGLLPMQSVATVSALPAPVGPDQPAALEAEARGFIARLTEADPVPIKASRADHFVTKEQVISLLPASLVQTTSIDALEADPKLRDNSPITVIRRIDQIESTTAERLISDAGGDLDQIVPVFENAKVRQVKVRELLQRLTAHPTVPVSVVRRVEYFEITTPAELQADTSLDRSAPIQVIKEAYALEAASVADLLRAKRALAPDTVFYVRTVRPEDHQGLWGIVMGGLVENFGRGMAIRRGKRVETYKVDIPRMADEVRADKESSFLGKLIHRKTQDSYVYNFKENRMGRNPDQIFPGQEIVIIDFRPDELVTIYRHFVEQRG